MNVLIIGAGASYATHRLPIAASALQQWEGTIGDHYGLLALALDLWVGENWQGQDLERAWTTIDHASKERAGGTFAPAPAGRDLGHNERTEVWRRAFVAAATEPSEPNYYRTQIEWARDLGHSTEEFLSVAAGWELRRLIQEKFVVDLTDGARPPYEQIVRHLQPTAVISFNYDTLVEQSLPAGGWNYSAPESDNQGIQILKPHGSVNWTHLVPRAAGLCEQVLFDVPLRPQAMGYQGNWLVQNAVIGLRSKIEHTAEESSRHIRRLFRHILRTCEDALAQTERIWVVGYRFAAADTGFLDTLARSLARRGRVSQLSVIAHGNPQDLLPRIRNLFAIPSDMPIEHCFCGLERWAGLGHGFCEGLGA